MNVRYRPPTDTSFLVTLYRNFVVCILFLLLPAAVHAAITVTPVPITSIEGSPFNGTVATFTSTGSQLLVDLTAVIDWGDGTPTSAGTITGPAAGVFTVAGAHTYPEDGTYTLTVTVTDSATPATGVSISTATIGEALVTISSLGPFSVAEGTPFSGNLATYTDPGSPDPASSFTATVDWGDGTTTAGTLTLTGVGALTVSGTHTYFDEGSFTITVTVDETGQNFPISTTDTINVTEADVLTPTAVPFSAQQGVPFSGTVATFADTYTLNTPADFTATINWGDATPVTAGTISGGGATYTVTGSHTYAGFGVFPVTVTLTEDAPGTATATANSTATVIAPPTIAKSFAPTTVIAGATTTLTFTLTNPAANTVALTGVGFTDILPGGLGIADSSASVCGGTLTSSSGTRSIVLSGATIAISGQCQFSVPVLAVSIGNFMNVTGNVTSSGGGTGATASAALTAVVPPLIPTMSAWALALLAAILFFATLRYTRQRRD